MSIGRTSAIGSLEHRILDLYTIEISRNLEFNTRRRFRTSLFLIHEDRLIRVQSRTRHSDNL